MSTTKALARIADAARRVVASRAVRGVFFVVAAALCGVAVVWQWPQARGALTQLSTYALSASFVAAVASLGCAMQVWRVLLADLGSPLPMPSGARVFFVSQLSKYIPGSVWPLVAQVELGRDMGVPRQRSAAAFVLALLVANASGLCVAVVTLPLLAGYGPGPFRWLALMAPVFILVAHPRVLNPMLGWALRFTRQQPPERGLSGRGIVTAYLWSVAGWAVAGTHVGLLVLDLGARGGQVLAVAVGGFALAWSAGFAVVVLPAGAGVRDLALAAALVPVLGAASALVAALASRLFLTISDLLTGGIGLLLPRPPRRAGPDG